MGGAEGSPFVDFLFRMFCTESFHLEVHPAGLSTQNLSCPSRTSRPASEPVSPGSTRERVGSYLAGVLWTGLKGDGTRQV